jgi:putative ABC transport system permease protein
MNLLTELRYGARTLRKSPGLMVVATIALAFGIGVTAVMWSIIYGALLKGLPYDQGDRIMAVYRANPSRNQDRMGVTVHDYADWSAQQRVFDDFGASRCGTMNLSGGDKPERYDGCWVTASAMTISRVQPMLGRLIRAGEDKPGGEAVTVLGYSIWRDRYGSDPGILGKGVRINGKPYTVVGVMPDGYLFPDNAKLWVPEQQDPLAIKRGAGDWLDVVGRLKPGVSIAEANTAMNGIAARIEKEHKDTNEGIRAIVKPWVDANIGPEATHLLYTMLGAVGFVLLIACANVANLLLDRAAHRTKEVGVRTALGASRSAIVRQFIAEAAVLSALGAVLGTVIAYFGIIAFNRAIADSDPPFYIDIRLHPPVLLFIAGVALLASCISGFLPAIQSARMDISEILKDESRGASSLHIGKLSRALVMFEIALSCGLLVAAALMTKSVTKLRDLDPGFTSDNVFTARVAFPGSTDTVHQRQFFEQLGPRLAAIPGVQAAAISSGIPGIGRGERSLTVEGKTYQRTQDHPRANYIAVTPSYFETLGIRVRSGRLFSESDNENAPKVAIVTESFVKTQFNGGDAIGRRFQWSNDADSLTWHTIVGVIPNVFTGDNEHPFAESVLVPFAQTQTSYASVIVRTASSPMSITPAVRSAVASLDADTPIYFVYSMPEAIARPTWFIRVFGTMFMIFGVIALFLAGVGLYAVMAFSVSRRTREVGIRMALGAKTGDVIRMVFRQGLLQLGIGLSFGMALAYGVSTLLSNVLFDVQPRDPVVFGAVVAVLATAGLLACYVPAKRATGVDPLVALRTD